MSLTVVFVFFFTALVIFVLSAAVVVFCPLVLRLRLSPPAASSLGCSKLLRWLYSMFVQQL